MINIPGVNPLFIWIGFIVMILFFLVLDLGFFNRKRHALSVKEAVIWTGVWFSLAMIFNLFIWYTSGQKMALEFFTGYLIEKALSVDNLFVILLIFSSFKIDPKHQHRILFWGIIGAIIMRGLMIGIGSALISAFHWILYLFGAFLIYAGIKIFFKKEDTYDPHDSFIVRFINKIVPVSKKMDGNLFVRHESHGRFAITILFVALLVIEFTDLVFAFDSIPAIFGITLDPFIVFTSNIFAILGLRSLYFVILKAHKYFVYLPLGLGCILVFIGIKMLIEPFLEIHILVSLAVVVFLLVVFTLASVFFGSKKKSRKDHR